MTSCLIKMPYIRLWFVVWVHDIYGILVGCRWWQFSNPINKMMFNEEFNNQKSQDP